MLTLGCFVCRYKTRLQGLTIQMKASGSSEVSTGTNPKTEGHFPEYQSPYVQMSTFHSGPVNLSLKKDRDWPIRKHIASLFKYIQQHIIRDKSSAITFRRRKTIWKPNDFYCIYASTRFLVTRILTHRWLPTLVLACYQYQHKSGYQLHYYASNISLN